MGGTPPPMPKVGVMSSSLTLGLHNWPRRLAEWVLRGEAPERVVYGTILVGALIAAESGVHDGYVDKVGSTLLALAIYWLAHSYSTVVGRRIATRERLSLDGLRRAMVHDWGIVRGACIPLMALVVCWLAGASQETGVNVAVWAAIASLIAFELLAGVRSRSRPKELVFECGVGVAMGLAILALKSLAH
jgi:membrane protein YqaA with SNARE-associated domain